jgi:hypothetical protein
MKTGKITPITEESIDKWWDSSTKEVKWIFSGINSEESDYYNRIFWKQLCELDKNSIYRYWLYRIDKLELSKDDANSLLMCVICILSDMELENRYGIEIEKMCDDDGNFYEVYQTAFIKLYDDIEDRILNNNF